MSVDSGTGEDKENVSVASPVMADVRRVLLELHAPSLGKGESVRVSGNTPELGKWNVHCSKPLTKREGAADMWYTELEVAERGVEYRYLVVQSLRVGEEVGLRVVRRETFIQPRRLALSRTGSPTEATDSSTAVRRKDDGTFGYSEEGEHAEDGGWLVGTSELQLQLQDSASMHPIRIDTLPHHTLFSILVTPLKYCSKDEDVCRVADYLPVEVKVLDRESGGCEFKVQGEHGHTFLPSQMLVFWTQARDFNYLAFTVDIYSVGKEGRKGEKEEVCHVGRTSILPQHLRDLSGRLVLTILSPQLLPMGTITLNYIIVLPARGCPQAIHRTRESFAHYWKKHKRTLDIGHRGLGDSHHAPEELQPSATENTIASLKRAGAHGADYVEFDVQLTRDLVPVVYHDFTVCTTLARRGFVSGELYQVYVKDLTLRQLHHLKLDHSSALPSNPSSRDTTPYASDTEGSYTSSDEVAAHQVWPQQSVRHTSLGGEESEEEGPERRTFPKLEQVFKSLPPHIGFNIEVKYPVPHRDDAQYDFPYFERNMMADLILNVVYRLARHRKIIFSCFDADMCTILHRKQPKYPVLFLSTALSSQYPVPVDLRARSFQDCMMHANAEKLLGVNVSSDIVLETPRLVAQAHASQLVVFTWGQLNNEYANLLAQRRMGVHAIIYDRITNIIPPQKNVFVDEVDAEGEEGEEEECSEGGVPRLQVDAPS